MKKYYDIGKNLLFPICRSITGNGTKKTLQILKSEFPSLKIKKIKFKRNVKLGGFKFFNKENEIRDIFVKDFHYKIDMLN